MGETPKVADADVSYLTDLSRREQGTIIEFCKPMTIAGVAGWFCLYVYDGWVGSHFGPWRWVSRRLAKRAWHDWKAGHERDRAERSALGFEGE